MNEEITNRSYAGMTVNERLWESGLMDEFDVVKKVNKQRAIEILQQLEVDKPSIFRIIGIKNNIPTDKLIKSFCNYYPQNTLEELNEYDISWLNKRRVKSKNRVDHFFAFSVSELLFYLEINDNECDKVINESYDKRSNKSTFIQENNDEFEVGIYDYGYKDVVKWKTKNMAVADYLLLSWSLTRLKK